MQHPDEGTIHAWLDGALTVEEASGVEAHVAGCSQCSAAIAEARGLVAASSRIMLALDDVPGGVIPVPVAKPRRWYARNDFRAAAAVVLVAGASLVVVRNGVNVLPKANVAAVAESGVAADVSSAGQARSDLPVTTGPARQRDAGADDGGSLRAGTQAVKGVAANPGIKGEANSGAPISLKERRMAVTDGAEPPAASTQRAQSSSQQGERARSTAMESAAPAMAERSGMLQRDMPPVGKAAPMELSENRTPLTIVRVDSTSAVRRTVYQVSSGVEVTLSETGPADFFRQSAGDDQKRRAGARAQPTSPTMAPAAALPPSAATRHADAAPAPQRVGGITAGTASAVDAARTNTISWADSKSGKQYTLSGAVSREQLEVLRVRIESGKR